MRGIQTGRQCGMCKVTVEFEEPGAICRMQQYRDKQTESRFKGPGLLKQVVFGCTYQLHNIVGILI